LVSVSESFYIIAVEELSVVVVVVFGRASVPLTISAAEHLRDVLARLAPSLVVFQTGKLRVDSDIVGSVCYLTCGRSKAGAHNLLKRPVVGFVVRRTIWCPRTHNAGRRMSDLSCLVKPYITRCCGVKSCGRRLFLVTTVEESTSLICPLYKK